MKITIGKFARGVRAIFVDDIQWGVIQQHRHGSRGSSYTFQNITRALLRHPDGRLWTVHTGGLARDHDEDDDTPLDLRLADAVRTMIALDILQDPTVLREEARQRREAAEAAKANLAAEEQASFEARAREAIGVDFALALGNDGVDHLSRRIVEAMRWAQGQ